MYVFVSFVNAHTAKNIGCCIVYVRHPLQANERCKKLGLMPKTCNHARGFVLTREGFKEQGMVLNRFYTTKEMKKMGFQRDEV